jgi:hypothetical protein
MRIIYIRNNEIDENLLQISEPDISQPAASKTLLKTQQSHLLLFCKWCIFDGIGNGILFVMIAEVKKGLIYNSYYGISQEYLNQKISEKPHPGTQHVCRCPITVMGHGKSGANKEAVTYPTEVVI